MNIAFDVILHSVMLSSICFILFLMAWRIESNYSLILTPFLLIMVFELSRVFPGFIYAVFVGISNDSYATLIYFTGFTSLLCGFICSIGYLRQRTTTPEIFHKKPITIKSESEIFVAIICGSSLLVLAGVYMYQGFPAVTNALLGLLIGDDASEIASQVSASRLEITKGHYFGGVYRGYGIISTLIRQGWPLLVSMALIVYWKTKKIKWLCLAFILFILSFIFIAGDGTRGPFVNSLIIYIILFSFIKKIRLRFIFLTLIALISIPILLSLYSAKMHSLIGQENFVVAAVANILDRILIGNSINDVYAIEFVNDGTIKLRLGMLHFRDFLAVFPGVAGDLPFSNELAMLINPTGSATTFASGTYITKAYVDFGIIGVGVIFLFIGILVGISQTFILRVVKKDPFHLAIGVMLTYFTGLLVMTTIMSIMSSLLMLMLYCVFLRATMLIYHNIKSIMRQITIHNKTRQPFTGNNVDIVK